MEMILYAVVGWLFGLISSIVLDWNRALRTVHSLRKALRFELREVANRFVGIVWLLGVRTGRVDAELLKWLRVRHERYQGLHRNERLIAVIRTLEANPEQVRKDLEALRIQGETSDLGMKVYPTPALNAAVAMVADFSPKEQVLLLELKTQLTLFDAIVDDIREYARMTFDSSITGPSRAAVENNIEKAYEQALQVSRSIVDRAAELTNV